MVNGIGEKNKKSTTSILSTPFRTFERLPAVAVLEVVGELPLVLVAGGVEIQPVAVLEAVLERALVRARHAKLGRVLVLPPDAPVAVWSSALKPSYSE